MQSFMIALLTCSVTMSAIALFYMAITPLLSKRYSAKGRYYTWLIVVIGLIIPFRPHFDNAVLKIDVPPEMVLPIIQAGNRAPMLETNSITASPSFLASISIWQILMIVWLAGVVIFLAYHAIKHYRFVTLAGRWSESVSDKKIISVLDNLKSEMGISKSVDVRLCASAGSPMMIGFIHPQILLPQIDFSPDELRFILAHELAHYKRGDLWYKALTLLASAIHWFNPVVCFIAKAIDVQCELSCDNEVISHTDAETRQHYSEAIIGVVTYQSKMKTALSTNFYGGKKGMKKRIFSIMDMGKKKAGVAVICGVLLTTMGTGFAFAGNTTDVEAKESSYFSAESISSVTSVTLDGDTATTNDEIKSYNQAIKEWKKFGFTYNVFQDKYFYNGNLVRFFVDNRSSDPDKFVGTVLDWDEGTCYLVTRRDSNGALLAIDEISADEAAEIAHWRP